MNPWLELQDSLRKGLSVFLNGENLTRTSYLLYPVVDRQQSQFWSLWVARVNQSIARLPDHNESLVLSITPEVRDKSIGNVLVSKSLAALASFLRRNIPEHLADADWESVPCREYDASSYEGGGSYLRPVVALQHFSNQALLQLTSGVYLHGSMATLDYVQGSSDLDALVVVKDETVSSPECLEELRRKLVHSRRWFYKIDFSQHHGYSVLSELDMRFFSEAFFPRVLLAYLTSLSGANTLCIRPRTGSFDPSEGCLKTVAYIRRQSSMPKSLRNWYSLKLFLQSVLLLPTLFLQARGIPVYKRDSFSLARPHFSDVAWSIVRKASGVRDLGPQKILVSPTIDNLIERLPNPWMASLIHRHVRNGISPAVWQILGDDWLIETSKLMDEIERQVAHG